MRSVLSLALILALPAFAGQGNNKTPPGLEKKCAQYEEPAAPASQDELGDALAELVVGRLAPLGVDPGAPVMALSTETRTVAIAQHGSKDDTRFVAAVEGDTITFGKETLEVADGSFVSVAVSGDKAGLVTTLTVFNADGKAVAERKAINGGPWLSLGGITFQGSSARLEDGGGRGRVVVSGKYGDILIDGVPLEFD